MKIVIENLTKEIGGRTVLDNVSMECESGIIYGLEGENGSGKTMLMRAVCGLIRPTKGSVKIDNLEIRKDIDCPKSVGVLIEHPAFIEKYTAYKNLKLLSMLNEKTTDSDIRDLLKKVGLDPDDKRTYKKFSLGMKQRLGIAGAFLGYPELILLDEPFNGLDEAGQRDIADLILTKKKDSLIIVSCHDHEELTYIADEIYKMENGRLRKE